MSILNSKIGKNLYGHGDILDIEIADTKDTTVVDPATLRAPDFDNYDSMSSNPLSKSRTEFGKSSRQLDLDMNAVNHGQSNTNIETVSGQQGTPKF